MDQPRSLDEIGAGWRERDTSTWREDPDRYLDYGRQAVALGHPTLAVDILNEGLSLYPRHAEMAYTAALALVNSGAMAEAERRISHLLGHLPSDDILYTRARSLAGRIAKDRWAKLGDTPEGQAALRDAAAHYARAYDTSGDPFPGINAASMHLLAGEEVQALEIAREVKAECLRRARQGVGHWLAATLGEACLLRGETEEATQWYGRAAREAGDRLGDLASMRRQLRLLEGIRPAPAGLIAALGLPNVAVFVGHMIDHPERPVPRFPAALAPRVGEAIGAAIERERIGLGYTSLACGADVLFVEEMARRGHEVNVVLPFRRDDFVHTSVAFAGPDWVERFEHALGLAAQVSYAVEEGYLGDRILFDYTARLLQGASLLRARALSVEALLLAVADPASEGPTGGSLATLREWRAAGRRATLVDLARLRGPLAAARAPRTATPAPADEARHAGPWGRREVKTMLFADMVGFSRLAETDAPAFIVHFLGEIARIITRSEPRPTFRNTWGDGLFLVFDEVVDAARFALRLRDRVARYEWREAGLPEGTRVRVGMHTGPVFPARDPIIERDNFFGSHVNRAARIEPITAPGAVYVSEQSAALLAAAGAGDLACDYLGERMLAKAFGSRALYRLRRANEVE